MMLKQPLNSDHLLGSREIRFIRREESNYPTLMRLCMDFDFCVLQLQRRVYSHISNRHLPDVPAFVLASHDYRISETAITPACESLRKLNDYVTEHQIDILHDYLFGDSDEDFSEQIS